MKRLELLANERASSGLPPPSNLGVLQSTRYLHGTKAPRTLKVKCQVWSMRTGNIYVVLVQSSHHSSLSNGYLNIRTLRTPTVRRRE
jgi:hypothetical protein